MSRSEHRSLTERWVITGTLVLETPAHFGNGDADPLVDLPLLFDEVEGRPLLPGTSIAGALRNYLREIEFGYSKVENSNSMVTNLFGSARETADDGEQSDLIVNDAIGTSAGVELRDGVTINPETRTAEDSKKFDMQLLAAGTTFPLRFELLISENSQAMRDALATALDGFEKREITIGARKRRGFGQCSVKDWKVFKYDLATKQGLLDWLGSEYSFQETKPMDGKDLPTLLNAKIQSDDKRSFARLTAAFAIDGTMMIRSGFGDSDTGPDTTHLHSKRPSKKLQPVMPGTSLAGVLRQRAIKIARTISNNNKTSAQEFVDAMFGKSEIKPNDKNAKASRVTIKETEIENASSLVVTRVKIDRFTGGAFESALFSEQPVIGKPNTKGITIDIHLRNPTDAELGLLLLLLKDLWTGDLPIGGESGIGRGRLKGLTANLITQHGEWNFAADGENVNVTPNAERPESWVQVFNQELKKSVGVS
ncbi:MAG: hypothetical protein KF758_16970 [Anaerolineales bacterium]|nr:hypothetical protein [Anaerolineales bacterium]